MQDTFRRLVFAALLAFAGTASAQIVNIDSRDGFAYDSGGSNPAPVPGQHINLIGTPPVTLSLAPGNYVISNAAGQAGALFSAWSFNVGSSGWAWAFVMADNATSRVIDYYEAGRGSSAAAVAALPEVQNFSANFTLSQPTTLLFTLRDYYVPDNAGGISVKISPAAAVPEPGTAALGLFGGLAVAGLVGRRRRARQSRTRRELGAA